MEEPGSGPTDEGGQPLVSQGELGLEQLDALGDHRQRSLGGMGWIGQGVLVRSEPATGSDQGRGGAAVQRLPQVGWGGDQQRLELVDGRGAGLDRAAAGGAQRPDRLHDPVAPLGGCGRRASQHGAGGRLGVDRVRPATLAADAPVRPVDLDHPHLLVKQVASQAGAIAASALHTDSTHLTVTAKPAQQLLVAATVSRELTVAKQPSLLIEHGSVMGATVGVDPADDNPGALGHAEVAFPLDDRAEGTHRPGGRTHQ